MPLIFAITSYLFNDEFRIFISSTIFFYNCLLLLLHYCCFLDGYFLDGCDWGLGESQKLLVNLLTLGKSKFNGHFAKFRKVKN